MHESPLVMLVPLIGLSVGAVGAGYLLKNDFIGGNYIHFWGSSIDVTANSPMGALESLPAWAAAAPLAIGIAGFAVAFVFYVLAPAIPGALSQQFGGLYRFLLNKWYFDELYDWLFVRPALRLAKLAWRFGDEQVIDGVPNGLAALTTDASTQTVKLQTGSIALYAFVMLIGLLGFLSLFLWVR